MAAIQKKGEAQPKNAKRAGKKSSGKLLWLMVVVMALASFALPTLLLLSAGLIPTFVAWIVDRHRDGHAPMAVGLLNLAGLLPSLLGLWMGGHTMGISARIMSDPYTWLFAFGAAAVGWLLVLGLPRIVETAITFRNESEIERLKGRQQALIAEWGAEVSGKSAPD